MLQFSKVTTVEALSFLRSVRLLSPYPIFIALGNDRELQCLCDSFVVTYPNAAQDTCDEESVCMSRFSHPSTSQTTSA